jgi:tetratricopeptide (TPR) repeat protein
VWRTGANSANALTFGDTVFINGTKINPGKYGFVSIPDDKNWTLIITKQLDVTGTESYKQDQDVVRVEAKTKDMSESMETLTMQFANVKTGSCELHLMWDKTAVSLPITTDTEGKMKAQIDQLLKKDNRPYYNAAMYYMNNGKDLNQALVWFNKALEIEPDVLRNHYQKANCLYKMGKKEEAKNAVKKGIDLAKAQKNDDFVKLNETLLAELNK